MMDEKNELKNIAFRPTQLVNSKYQLTPVQNDIIDFILAEINEEKRLGVDEDKVLYQISVSKYKGDYDVKDDSQIYRYVKQGVDTFQNTKGFWIISKRGNPLFIQWLSSIEYIRKQGIIEVEISSKFKEFLWHSNQTLFYEIKYSINLKNKYSKRLYYYLRDKRKLKEYTVNLETLSDIFMLSDTYRKSFAKMESKVLKIAMDEINNGTDISFDYDKIKGKKKSGQTGIIKIKFYIHEAQVVNNDYVVITEPQKYEQIIDAIHCGVEDAKNIYNIGISKGLDISEIMETVTLSKQLAFVSDKVGFIVYTLNQVEPKQDNLLNNVEEDEIVQKIINRLSCSKKEAESIKSISDKNNRSEDDIMNVIDYTLEQHGIENKAGYIITILKNGFVNVTNKSVHNKTNNQFNNFTQREYSKEEMINLERKVLGIN